MLKRKILWDRQRAAMLAAMLAATLSATAAVAKSVTVTYATGRTVQIDDASRIVSVGGAVTETLYALGEQKRIVGVDTTSLYPPRALKRKPNVGYMRQLSPEGVLGVNPTLILAVEGAGPKETLSVLSAAKVPLVIVPDNHTGDGIVTKTRMIADAIGAKARGACLAAQVQADLDALARVRARVDKPKRVLFLLSFISGRAMAAGHATAADGIIGMAGARNAIDGFDGYKPIGDEAVIAAKPDVILAMLRGRSQLTAETVFAHPGFALTPAAKTKSFIAMDGLYLLGFGPRTARAARDLAVTLDPNLERTALPSEQNEAGPDCKP